MTDNQSDLSEFEARLLVLVAGIIGGVVIVVQWIANLIPGVQINHILMNGGVIAVAVVLIVLYGLEEGKQAPENATGTNRFSDVEIAAMATAEQILDSDEVWDVLNYCESEGHDELRFVCELQGAIMSIDVSESNVSLRDRDYVFNQLEELADKANSR